MFHPHYRQFKVLSAVTGLSFALFTSAYADFGWTGATSSDPTDATNYNGTPPVYGATNSGNFNIQNGTAGSPLVYSSAQGSTSFTGGNLRIGSTTTNGAAAGSELDVTGGVLAFTSSGTSTIGYNGSGTIGVSGGTLSVNGSGDQFWFGNNQPVTANISNSGTFNIGAQFLLSRDGSTVNINLSGNGLFNVTSASGTQYAAAGGAGLATINIGGNGIFEQTGSSAINFGPNFKFNFLTGSLGQISILNDSASTLNGFITGGNVEINGVVDTTLADYTVTGAPTTGSQGIITLASAAVPEPTSWAMMLTGALALIGVARFRKSAV